MNIFLIDTGRGKINPIQKEIRTELPQGEIQYNEKLVKALGKDFLMEFSELKGEEQRQNRRSPRYNYAREGIL